MRQDFLHPRSSWDDKGFGSFQLSRAPLFLHLLRFLNRNLQTTRCSENFHLEGQGDLVSWLIITPITHIVTLVIPIINRLLSPADPPSNPLTIRILEVSRSPALRAKHYEVNPKSHTLPPAPRTTLKQGLRRS